MTQPRFVALAALNPAAVQAAREVFETGFPAALRAPFSDLAAPRPDERTQVLLSADGEVLGLVLVRDMGETRWTFLRYFVVTAARRGQGLGSALWTALCADLTGRGTVRLAFDVEDPDDEQADADERTERTGRVRFYGRLGAALIPVPLYAPPHHGAPNTAAIPLRLMAAELDGGTGTAYPPVLDESDVEALVGAVMEHRYGVITRSPDGSSR